MPAHSKVKSQKHLLTVFLSLYLILLQGCSPHPAAGTWNASNENSAQLTKIVVHFVPRAEIYSSDKNKTDLHCSWSATDSLSIKLECLSSEEQTIADVYQLNISREKTATLKDNKETIGSFIKAEK